MKQTYNKNKIYLPKQKTQKTLRSTSANSNDSNPNYVKKAIKQPSNQLNNSFSSNRSNSSSFFNKNQQKSKLYQAQPKPKVNFLQNNFKNNTSNNINKQQSFKDLSSSHISQQTLQQKQKQQEKKRLKEKVEKLQLNPNSFTKKDMARYQNVFKKKAPKSIWIQSYKDQVSKGQIPDFKKLVKIQVQGDFKHKCEYLEQQNSQVELYLQAIQKRNSNSENNQKLIKDLKISLKEKFQNFKEKCVNFENENSEVFEKYNNLKSKISSLESQLNEEINAKQFLERINKEKTQKIENLKEQISKQIVKSQQLKFQQIQKNLELSQQQENLKIAQNSLQQIQDKAYKEIRYIFKYQKELNLKRNCKFSIEIGNKEKQFSSDFCQTKQDKIQQQNQNPNFQNKKADFCGDYVLWEKLQEEIMILDGHKPLQFYSIFYNENSWGKVTDFMKNCLNFHEYDSEIKYVEIFGILYQNNQFQMQNFLKMNSGKYFLENVEKCKNNNNNYNYKCILIEVKLKNNKYFLGKLFSVFFFLVDGQIIGNNFQFFNIYKELIGNCQKQKDKMIKDHFNNRSGNKRSKSPNGREISKVSKIQNVQNQNSMDEENELNQKQLLVYFNELVFKKHKDCQFSIYNLYFQLDDELEFKDIKNNIES